MSDDKNSIPLVESNSPPLITPRQKRRAQKNNGILKVIVFVGLVILVLVLIAALVIALFRKCDGSTPVKPKPSIRVAEMRKNNSYWNNIDLPNFAHPLSYGIKLQLIKEALNLSQHRQENYFFGYVNIIFTMTARSKFLVFHMKNITMRSIKINHLEKSSKKRADIKVVEAIYDKFFDQQILVFSEPLLKSKKYSLEIQYSGNISTYTGGVVRTFYKNLKLHQDYDILYSKFEPIGARRMFPCFDQPDKKALYTVQIIHKAKYTALSNMPRIDTSQIGKELLIVDDKDLTENDTVSLSTFNSTVIPMSTYLVAFALVEDFVPITGERKPGFNVSIWVPKGSEESGPITLAYSIAMEKFLERFLNYSSPMTKTDHIYIPNFMSGAMENWGLITYREQHLMLSPGQPEFQAKKAHNTIAHELAHIWFGNWVTMRTWQDLWLNEGFATFFASYAYNVEIKNTIGSKADEMFLYHHRQILSKDTAHSNPVRLNTTNYDKMFNSFTYSKGQSLLIWLQSIMGDENFRLGIQAYIKQYAMKNPTTEQFFVEMQKKGPKDVIFTAKLSEFFEPWLNWVGYPILTVNYDIGNKQIILSQRSVVVNSSVNTIWPIHTVYKSDSRSLEEPIYISKKYHRINQSLGENEVVLFNGEGRSYIRVNYSGYLWGKIIESIKSNNPIINKLNKIMLFDDNINFALSNEIDLNITFDFINTLVNETDFGPWSIFFNKIFSRVYEMFKDEVIFVKVSNYVMKLSKKAVDEAIKLGMSDDLNVYDELFQRQIFFMNCQIDNKVVLNIFSRRFELWLSNPKTEKLPRHLVSLILYYGIKSHDTRETWMKMWRILNGTEELSYVSKDEIAFGLAGTSKPYLLTKLLNYLLISGTHASNNDKYSFFSSLSGWILQTSNGRNTLIRWILTNQMKIKRYSFGDHVSEKEGSRYLEKTISEMASSIYDNSIVGPLLRLSSNPRFTMENIDRNYQYRFKYEKILRKFL